MNNIENLKREIKIKRIISIVLIVILVIAVSSTIYIYITNIEFRNWVDLNILRKDINSEDVPTIDLNESKNNQIFCYNNNICILKDKNLILYNQSGIKDSEIQVNINTALFDANDKYLAIAEKGGQELCVIYSKNFLWKEKVDGEIMQIHINKNGYVAIVTTDTTYKSIITLFNVEGKQILKNYLSSTRIVEVDISNDNNYIAFSELDSSGVLIKSNVQIISVEKAKINSEEAIVYKYEAPNSRIITKIKYQDKNELVCMSNDSIDIINMENERNLITINNNITFASANLTNNIAYVEEEKNSVLNYNSKLNIINVINNQKNTYELDGVAKEMYAYGNVIGINTGIEIYFINTNGLLIKKYTSNQEITKVIISNNIGLIIYKDKIEIISL